MKVLIITIIIQITYLKIFGHDIDKHILYRWETNLGTVWKSFGDENLQLKYEGNIKNGKPFGQGIFSFPSGKKIIGEFKDGINGMGSLITLGGSKYVGEFKNGKRTGKGVYTFFSDRYKYIGEFVNGKFHGNGTMLFSNGNKYTGEWRRNKIWNGKYYNNNGKLIGKFKEGNLVLK